MAYQTTKRDRPIWLKLLVHPMLYLSLILHGLIFAIPGSPEEEIPEDLEEEEEIQITMLPAIVEPEPEIPVEELLPEPPPQEPPPQPVTAAPPPPPPEPAPQQQQAPPPEEPEPEPEEPELPELPEAPVFDPTPYRMFFSTQMETLPQNLTDQFGDMVLNTRLWQEPEAFFVTGDDGEERLRSGIIQTPQWLNDVRPENIRPERSGAAQAGERVTDQIIYLGAQFQEGVTVNPVGEYGGGPLFEILSPEQEPILYINAAPSSSAGSSTFLVLWDFNPNSPPPEATSPSAPPAS